MQVYKWHHTASWDSLGSKPPEFSGGFAEGAISRDTASKPPSWMLTYDYVRSASRRGFSLSDAEISPSVPRALFRVILRQRPLPQCGHVREVRSLLRKGLFRAVHPNGAFSDKQPERASLSTMYTFSETVQRTFCAGAPEHDVSFSETEPEPQGGDYLSAEP